MVAAFRAVCHGGGLTLHPSELEQRARVVGDLTEVREHGLERLALGLGDDEDDEGDEGDEGDEEDEDEEAGGDPALPGQPRKKRRR